MFRTDNWETIFRAAVEQSFNAVLITDASFDQGGPLILYANHAFCRMTGYTESELIGRSPRILQGEATDPKVINELRNCLKHNLYFHGSTINYRKDGSPYHVEWSISPVRDVDGHVTHYVSVQQNISERARAEQERHLLSQALNVASDPILITDNEAHIVFANQAFERLTGYSSEEILGRTPQFLQSGEHDAEFYRNLRSALSQGEAFRATFSNRRKDGDLYYAEQSIAAVQNSKGAITHYVSVGKDITDLIQREKLLHEMASFDKLTGLLNRHAGEQELNFLYQQYEKEGQTFSLLLVDIDHFKQINDTHGHPAGDRVLALIARRLKKLLRTTDYVVRWGGEEFMLLLPEAPLEAALRLAERICQHVASEPTEVGQITLSCGVGELLTEETPASLIARVDKALYTAKRNGRNRVESAHSSNESCLSTEDEL